MVHKRGKWVALSEILGYWQPANSIVGQTLFSNKYDLTSQTKDFEKMKDFLERIGIPFRIRTTRSSDDFMSKRWVVIPSKYPLTDLQEQMIREYAKKETTTFHE